MLFNWRDEGVQFGATEVFNLRGLGVQVGATYSQECSKVILAWGRTENNNQRIAARANEARKLLLPYEDKLYYLTDGEKVNIHPLCTSVRTGWQLEKADVSSELLASK